jgi:hypothetical protein
MTGMYETPQSLTIISANFLCVAYIVPFFCDNDTRKLQRVPFKPPTFQSITVEKLQTLEE